VVRPQPTGRLERLLGRGASVLDSLDAGQKQSWAVRAAFAQAMGDIDKAMRAPLRGAFAKPHAATRGAAYSDRGAKPFTSTPATR
jgi:hypothetical protein